MGRKFWTSFIVGLALTGFIVACRYSRPLADFYSLHIYPLVSAALSWISSPTHLSMQAFAIAAIVIAFIVIIVLAKARKWGWKKCVAREINLLVWTFVWFYLGWCVNYSRSTIFERTDTQKAQYDSTAFNAFIADFTALLNGTYAEKSFLDATAVDESLLESEIKSFYAAVPARYGLCKPKKWQHVKHMGLECLHSATGVRGYMGPLFSEFHLNTGLTPSQVPFVWAHEYSHLMGVSSEAEANWWAWNACMASQDPRIRYSACFEMMSYVLSNARLLLPEEDYRALWGAIRPEVVNEYDEVRKYWLEKRVPALDKAQTALYDLFLKSNSIPTGMKNYSEVVQMLMCIDYSKVQ